ncbi:MAG: hypothetical protein NTX79_05320 [Candidatus Micrarchaeota archaeon]|nr:hypothetical protein [Candidatus Micrarchaeota archaeon]
MMLTDADFTGAARMHAADGARQSRSEADAMHASGIVDSRLI